MTTRKDEGRHIRVLVNILSPIYL